MIGAKNLEEPMDVGHDGLPQAGEVVEGAGGIDGGKDLSESLLRMRVHVLHIDDHEPALRRDYREVGDRQPPGR